MTQKEFQDRVKTQVSAQEYAAIEVVYMNSDLEKMSSARCGQR